MWNLNECPLCTKCNSFRHVNASALTVEKWLPKEKNSANNKEKIVKGQPADETLLLMVGMRGLENGSTYPQPVQANAVISKENVAAGKVTTFVTQANVRSEGAALPSHNVTPTVTPP